MTAAAAEEWVPKGNKKLKTFIKEMEPFKLTQEVSKINHF